MSVPISTLNSYVKKLVDMGAAVDYWRRGSTYNDQPLRDADAVVVILPDNKWEHHIESLPRGTCSEIRLAMCLSKKIWLGYTPSHSKKPYMYQTVISGDRLSGMGGTTDFPQGTIDTHNAKDDHITEYYNDKRGVGVKQMISDEDVVYKPGNLTSDLYDSTMAAIFAKSPKEVNPLGYLLRDPYEDHLLKQMQELQYVINRASYQIDLVKHRGYDERLLILLL